MKKSLYIGLICLFFAWIIYIIVEIDKQIIVKDNVKILQEKCDSLQQRIDSLEKRKIELNFYVK